MSSPGTSQSIEAGDLRRAASSLVVSYGPDVLATCLAMLRDRSAAEDVTQEVFSDALRALATFRGDSSPRTWLLSIARNRCIDYLRARKRDPWGGALDDAAADPDAHADEGAFGSEQLADRSVVLRALDALAEGDRALIVLRFKNGLEYDELATAFGLREGTVRMRVSRALARMRQVLQSEAEPTVRAPAPAAAPAPAPAPFVQGPIAQAPLAMRARAAAPGAGGGAASFGAPLARAPMSWWERLKAWASGATEEPTAPAAPVARPIGALGLALVAWEPGVVSEELAAKLGGLVERVHGTG